MLQLWQFVTVYLRCSVLLSEHDVVPDPVGVDKREVDRLHCVIYRRQRDAQSRRDNDVGAPCDEPRTQMVQEVLIANGRSSLVWLWLEDDRVLIVTVQLDILGIPHLIQSLQLIGLEPRLDESLLLFALVETNFVIVDGRRDELVLLAEVVLLPLLVPDLEDLLLTGRLVDDARVDRALLRRLVDEIERVLRLLI